MSPANGCSGGVDSEPRYKRQRTAMACFSCRRRKTKCNGHRPQCDICISMGFECNYAKPPPASFSSNNDPEDMRRVEDRLGKLESLLKSVNSLSMLTRSQQISISTHLAGFEDTFRPAERAQQQETVEGISMTPDFTNPETPIVDLTDDAVDGMGAIAFADEFASGHFGNAPPLKATRFSAYNVGATSNPAFTNKINYAMREALARNKRSLSINTIDRDVSVILRPPSPYAMVCEKLTSTPSFESLNAFELPSFNTIIQLVDTFFSGTGMLFPYISKKSITDGIANLRSSGKLDSIRRSWLCLLNTIMAFATVLLADNEQKHDHVTQADVFFQRALKLLPNVALQPANIEILQALLLLTQYLQGTQRSTHTYNFQGLTVRVAFQIGLHCASGNSKDSMLEREIKNRCWYMTYILDKTCSMTFGRPPCIRNDYLQPKVPLEIDLETLEETSALVGGSENSEFPSTVACFGQSIKLYMIIGEIIDDIYLMNIPREADIDYETLIQRVTSIESKLESWKSDLPASLKIKTKQEIILNRMDSSDFARLSTVLTLRYLNARILLHRAVLTRFLDNNNIERTASTSQSVFVRSCEKISLDLSVLSAIEMIEIHHIMSKSRQRMLTTWWFSLYYVFGSALVVLAAMVVQHRGVVQIDSLLNQDMTAVYQKALKCLEYLGCGGRMAYRCGQYLSKLIQEVTTLRSQSDQAQYTIPPGPSDLFDAFTFPFSDFSDVSPSGLDMGPFMAGIEWESLV